MAYTPSARKSKSSPNNFGGMKVDANRVAMQYGSVMQTQDATGTPVTSPATVNTTTTLVVPQNAVSLTVTPVTNPVQVSEDSTQSTYYAVPAGASQKFEVSDQQDVYLKTASSTVVSFFFELI
jgi:hypothetical protein